jgi:hypothetical protein
MTVSLVGKDFAADGRKGWRVARSFDRGLAVRPIG